MEVEAEDGDDPRDTGLDAQSTDALPPQANDTRPEIATRIENDVRRAEGLPPLKKPIVHLPPNKPTSSAEHTELDQEDSFVLAVGQDCYWSVEIPEDDMLHLKKTTKPLCVPGSQTLKNDGSIARKTKQS